MAQNEPPSAEPNESPLVAPNEPPSAEPHEPLGDDHEDAGSDLIAVIGWPLIITAVLAFGVIAGVAGTYAWTRDRTAAVSSRQSLAEIAASELELAVGSIGEACGVAVSAGGNARESLRMAFHSCGPSPFLPTETVPDPLLLPPIPRRATELPELPRRAPKERPDPCLEDCARQQDRCRAACGGEPIGDAYSAWQACETRCLTVNSQCRLSCG